METLHVVILVVILAVLVALYSIAFKIYTYFERICDFLLRPIKKLSEKLEHLNFSVSGVVSDATVRMILMLLIFIGAFAYVVFAFFTMSPEQCIQTIFEGTTVGSFFQLWLEHFSPDSSIQYSAMVGVGISSFLSLLYMGYSVNTLNDTTLHWAIKYPLLLLFNLVFTCTSALLSFQLSDWFTSVADFGVDIYQILIGLFSGDIDFGFFSLFVAFGVGLLLLVMLYVALATFTVVLREYVATIIYGIFSIALLFLTGVAFQMWFQLPEYILTPLYLVALLATDFIRGNEKANEALHHWILQDKPRTKKFIFSKRR